MNSESYQEINHEEKLSYIEWMEQEFNLKDDITVEDEF